MESRGAKRGVVGGPGEAKIPKKRPKMAQTPIYGLKVAKTRQNRQWNPHIGVKKPIFILLFAFFGFFTPAEARAALKLTQNRQNHLDFGRKCPKIACLFTFCRFYPAFWRCRLDFHAGQSLDKPGELGEEAEKCFP